MFSCFSLVYLFRAIGYGYYEDNAIPIAMDNVK